MYATVSVHTYFHNFYPSYLTLLEFLIVINPIVVLYFFNFYTNIMLPYSQAQAVSFFLSDGSIWNFPITAGIC